MDPTPRLSVQDPIRRFAGPALEAMEIAAYDWGAGIGRQEPNYALFRTRRDPASVAVGLRGG